MTDPFSLKTGAYRVNNLLVLSLLFISLVGVGYFIASKGMLAVAALLVLPFAVFFLVKAFENPVVSFFAVYVVNFIALGLSRYILGAPFGLLVDGFLALTYIAVFFKFFYIKFDWSKLKNDVVILSLLWFGYTCFELFNPLSKNPLAWIYFMRGVSLYMLMTVILVLILFDKYKYFIYFLYLWAFFEILASIKGMIQLYIGLDPLELYWLNVEGGITHILFGELRVFSFFSDAGQFGASQAHTGMVASIIALTTNKNREKVFFLITAFFCFYGMIISGTRGIWGALAGAGLFFLILNRNFKLLIFGLVVGISVYVFFRYTYIGQRYYFIRRMRTGFDPNNPSLIVRLQNRQKLRPYLAVRPFGGGIGMAGAKAQRFTPNTFLANTPTDSWYVDIWAEQGIVGLLLHLGIMSFVLIKGSYIIMHRIRDPGFKGKMMAIISGIFGVMVSSYGNGVFGQMPTGLIMYTCMAFIFIAPKLDQEACVQKKSDNSLQIQL
ncbi:MAG: O-antigen ligase family protein [bacterium]